MKNTPMKENLFYRMVLVCCLWLPALLSEVHAQCYPLPYAQGLTVNCGQSTSLFATGSGSNFLWYSQPAGGAPLDTGNTFTTPVLTASATYYVETNDLTINNDTFSYTGTQQYWQVPANVYSIDVDMSGAQGGTSYASYAEGGLGGRTTFRMSVTPGEILYLYVGGQPANNNGGYNGGGSCSNYCTEPFVRGGGGASDIRKGGFSVSNRVAVAGGGGGSGYRSSSYTTHGGAGGGLTGGNGIYNGSYNSSYNGSGGSQTTGGTSPYSASTPYMGSLFSGGNTYSSSSSYNGGGGGGGWYGGGGGYQYGGGGGGSSYADPSLTSNVVHTQGYKAGNGRIIISYATVTCSSDRLPVTVNVVQNVVTPVVSGVTVTCGDTAEIVAAGSSGLFQWFDSYGAQTPIATGDTLRVGPILGNSTFYVRAVDNYSNPYCISNKIAVLVNTAPLSLPATAPVVTVSCGATATLSASGSTGHFHWYDAPSGGNLLGQGSTCTTAALFADTSYYYVEGISNPAPFVPDSVQFSYTGNIVPWTVPAGVYSIDVDLYGAQGGSTSYSQGGLGGRVRSTIPVTPGQVLYFNVGGQPSGSSGGYNGGGTGYSSYSGGGGGASDIRLTNTSSPAPADVLAVAGGGGGAGYYSSSSGYGGGSGGGLTATDGFPSSSYNGRGGTQVSGGNPGSNGGAGTFLKGGNGYAYSTGYNGGGGGSGWYGGGGGGSACCYYAGGGGGGSSYTISGATNVQHQQGINTGNGSILVKFQRMIPYCSSARKKITVITQPIPAPAVLNDTVVCSDTARVSVSGSSGMYRWYKSASGSQHFLQSDALMLPGVSADTTFYVEALSDTMYDQTLQFSYTGNVQTWTVPAGVYSVDVDLYGAQGGTNSSNPGGYGARVQGTLQVTPGDVLSIYVGGQPTSTAGGWNGGGNGYSSGRGGGGATDIRINGTSLSNRIIVAGAGGGAGWNNGNGYERGGSAGGSGTAENGWYSNSSGNPAYAGSGASQTAGGAGSSSYGGSAGTLGQGGNSNTSYYSGGGGAGWYGGGGAGYYAGGGGGSSYADPVYISNVIYTAGTTAQSTGNGVAKLSYTRNYCVSARVPVHIKVNSMADPAIVPVNIDCGDNALLSASSTHTLKWYNSLSDVQPFAQGGMVVTPANYVTDTVYVQAEGVYTVTGETDTVDFTYSGNVQSWTVPAGVHSVNVDLYGAQGGTNSSNPGGYGARVQGTLQVNPGDVLNIYVGEQPTTTTGGWNGGGNGYSNGRGGGGATDIRMNGTSLNNRVIVAGAGGGAGWNSGSGYERGGSAGGSGTAENGWYGNNNSTTAYCGRGATQSAGGPSPTSYSVTPGSFGQGSNSYTSYSTGGGGAGWYGGSGAGYYAGGGGGSSYADPAYVSAITYTDGLATQYTGNGKLRITYTPSEQRVCRSNKVPYVIFVDSLQAPAVTADVTVCNQGSAVFTASGGTGTYHWYENDSVVGQAASYSTGLRNSTVHLKVNYTNASGCVSAFSTASLNVVNLPPATVTAPASVCEQANAIQLQAATPGGTWSGNGITNAQSGIFDPGSASAGANQVSYTLYDPASGCSNTDSVIINVDTFTSAAITSASQSICVSSAAFNLTSQNTGGTWSGNGITNALSGEFTPSSAGTGTHKVYYIIQNGSCQSKDSVMISVTPAPVVNIGSVPAQLCQSASALQLTADVSGGTWSGTGISTSGLFTPAAAGTGSHTLYYVLSQNGCTATDSVTLTVIPSPLVSVSTTAQQLCETASPLSLSATPAGGTWSGTGISGNTFVPAGLAAGTYTVYYQVSGGGCTSVDSVTFSVTAVPDASITAPSSSICANSAPVQMSALQNGGTWSGNFITPGGLFNVAAAGTGSHYVYYNLSVNGCTATDSQVVTVQAVPVVQISTQLSAVCVNAPAVHLSATPSGGTWSGAGIVGNISGTFSPQSATTGNHEVYYTYTQNGCSATDTLAIEVSSIPEAYFAAGKGCVNTAMAFTDLSSNQAGAITSWNWSFGNGASSSVQNPSISYTQPGSYVVTLQVSTAAGCSDSYAQTVQVAAAPDAAFAYTLQANGNAVNFYPVNPTIGSAYLWTFGDGYSSTDINPLHVYNLAGSYTVCLTAEQNGCAADTCLEIATNTNVGLSEETTTADWRVFPNPVTSYVQVAVNKPDFGKGTYSLYDITGRMIQAPLPVPGMEDGQTFTIDLERYSLSPGTYNLVLDIDGVRHSVLLVKK